ncbi:MAG: hypothetical protein J6K42_02550 [Clostridia bacterium]|nr:hypothetical protein [Clostridia bacterium]
MALKFLLNCSKSIVISFKVHGKNGQINFNYELDKYYISIEPEIFLGGKITSIKIDGVSKDIAFPTGRNVYEVSKKSTYSVEVTGAQE